MSRSIKVQVPQGIGDIFWCYQRLAPHYETVNFVVLGVDHGPIQRRATPWLSLLPKVGTVDFQIVTSAYYHSVCDHYHPLSTILNSDTDVIRYGVNNPLERGIRLEDTDPYLVEWGVPLQEEECLLPAKDYWVLYVSGNLVGWTVAQWAELVDRLDPRVPVVVIGAEYDRRAAEPLADLLRRQNRRVGMYIGEHPARIVYLLRNCTFYLGYQSGLGILADNLKVKQLMMYFPWLDKLQYSWCQPGHQDTTFCACCFAQTPEEVAAKVRKTVLS